MLAQEIIAAKRDGKVLSPAMIKDFVSGVTEETVSDSQISALAMAVFFNGMNLEERTGLTLAMRDSGAVLDWTGLPGPVIDKHSTGGVGDNVSLMLAPALAACGAYVPMISGRGLGHTGGTLDKLASIPGYQTQPDLDVLQKVTRDVGCAIIGQTPEIAPADRRIYAVRDVTATVESIDLITASILSKKLAAGLDALVLDVKTGSGAFMASVGESRALARALVDIANSAGCRTTALITDMNEPLASAAGNALEISNVIRFLRCEAVDNRLWDVVVALGAELLVSCKLAPDVDDGVHQISEALNSGKAAEIFAKMAAALGGGSDVMEKHDSLLPKAALVDEVHPTAPGFITRINTRELGLAVVELGGGRRRATDTIDPSVGLEHLAGLGHDVEADTPLALVHAADRDSLEAAKARVRAAYEIANTPPEDGPVILERIG